MKKLVLFLILGSIQSFSQKTLSLNDLSAFENKQGNWTIVSEATASLDKTNEIVAVPGKGVILCSHEQGKYGSDFDLFTKITHGDIDLSFDFMMAKESNSGVYFQGAYEVQLFDSWGKKFPKYGDCGGIYERWDESKPEGQKGYEGIAPRVNACKAPGLWQHMEISFQAARFGPDGKKISNAIFKSVVLNGQLLHENVEVTGGTRGGKQEMMNATNPLFFQGDHGSLALRNIQYSNFDKPAGKISKINYKVFYGNYATDTDLQTLKADERGQSNDLTWEVSRKSNDYIINIKGNYHAPETGKYIFGFIAGGHGLLKIDGKEVHKYVWTMPAQKREASIDLVAGDHTFEIINNKRDGWVSPALGLYSAGPGFRSTAHHALSSMIISNQGDPILINSSVNTVLRSFMDVPGVPRLTHAVSVGTPDQLHYTYNMDNGNLVQLWRGGFLDATPMWNDRGDGSSRPQSNPLVLSQKLCISNDAVFKSDTLGSGYRPLGYFLDDKDVPSFSFKIFGQKVSDKTEVKEGRYLSRTLKFENSVLNVMLAEANKIERISANLYAVNDKDYFIQTSESENAQVLNGKTLMVNPKNGIVQYSIIY